MSTPALKIVGDQIVQQTEEIEEAQEILEEEAPAQDEFRAEVKRLMEERRTSITDKVRQWVTFWADFGVTSLQLDDFPIPLAKKDQLYVVEWLRERGFDVTKPRLGGSAVIHLEE